MKSFEFPVSRVVLALLLAVAGCSVPSVDVKMAGDAAVDTVASPGGGSSELCLPACPADSDCVGGSCFVHFGGTCSTNPDCPSSAICCGGADQNCDGTRLPTGDGTDPKAFVVSQNGLSVTDTITGLVWQRDASSSRAGCANGTTCTWAEAKAYCSSLILGGVKGWRLPTRVELLTIVDYTVNNPPLDATIFPLPLSLIRDFWTSTPSAQYPDDVGWQVSFRDGSSYKSDGRMDEGVRCVR